MNNSRFFKAAGKKAKRYLREPEELDELLHNIDSKLRNIKRDESIHQVIDYVKTFGRLVSAYRSGRYREISTTKLGLVVASLIYFISPLDLIPDFIPVLGLLDDLSVLAWVFNTVKIEIERFKDWEGEFTDFEDVSAADDELKIYPPPRA
ncbi:MAG: YkvA family protein [Catalinimonas sp.]